MLGSIPGFFPSENNDDILVDGGSDDWSDSDRSSDDLFVGFFFWRRIVKPIAFQQ
jgi:hypothetical protein